MMNSDKNEREARLVRLVKNIVLLGGVVFAPAITLAQFRVTQAPDFHRARELKVLSVVFDESNKMWAARVFPDGKKLLRIFARAESSITNRQGGSADSGSVQMSIDADGTQWFVNFYLPLPNGSRPYTVYVSGKRANEMGVPIYRLASRDAGKLGVILNVLKSQKPIE